MYIFNTNITKFNPFKINKYHLTLKVASNKPYFRPNIGWFMENMEILETVVNLQ